MKEDIGLVVANKEEALWIKQKENCEARLANLQEALVIETAFLKLAEGKVKELSSMNGKGKQ